MPHIQLNVTATDYDTLHIAARSALALVPGAKITSYTANGHVTVLPDVDPEFIQDTLRSAFRTIPGIKVAVVADEDAEAMHPPTNMIANRPGKWQSPDENRSSP